jgi:hypothetical protein
MRRPLRWLFPEVIDPERPGRWPRHFRWGRTFAAYWPMIDYAVAEGFGRPGWPPVLRAFDVLWLAQHEGRWRP